MTLGLGGTGHTSAVMCVQSDAHYKVVSGSGDKSILLWDTRQPAHPLRCLQVRTSQPADGSGCCCA